MNQPLTIGDRVINLTDSTIVGEVLDPTGGESALAVPAAHSADSEAELIPVRWNIGRDDAYDWWEDPSQLVPAPQTGPEAPQ
ncbi:hypothetical protein [Gordonia sihwensis]|uniref:hypothetical protein n=1 Tax=Gordonia sihwensis TaxID=173559 RepID=UPI003D95280E